MSNSSNVPVWLLEVKDDISKTNVNFVLIKLWSFYLFQLLERSGMS